MQVADYLGPDGLLSEALDDFQYRDSQCRLAEKVLETVRTGRILLAEAGPGVGKTYAYLVPLLAAGIRSVISTGTIALQDQLFERDIPRLGRILGRPVRMAVLKGRNNYLCLKRQDDLWSHTDGLDSPERIRLEGFRQWAATTTSGDLSECAFLTDHAGERSRLTSTVDSCEGRSCAFYERCFLVGARRRANEADLVITNHHLLFSDWLLKQDGFSPLLPEVEAFVLDEAHLIPDLAIQMFSESVSQSELEIVLDHPLFVAFRSRERHEEPGSDDQFDRAWSCLRDRGRTERLWSSSEWPDDLQDSLWAVSEAVQKWISCLDLDGIKVEERRRFLRIENMMRRLTCTLPPHENHESVWFEGSPKGFSLRIEPQDPGDRFGRLLDQMNAAWLLLSASLTVAGDFSYFRSRLGLSHVSEIQVSSPYDHLQQAMLFLPNLPSVDEPDYYPQFFQLALSLIKANPGGTFFLFTSHRALSMACEWFSQIQIDRPVFRQGDAPKYRLLERFQEEAPALLLGSMSFWEGVDVKGPALSLILIDRLPFASPADPPVHRRIRSIREKGGEPFQDYQLPKAILTLRQGVGRLLRHESDFGAVVIGDSRLREKSYGPLFLASLPPMQRAKEAADVVNFLQFHG
jgi:ATP-dependent DNA helicase DinG